MPPYFVFIKKSGGIVAQYLFNKFEGGVFGVSPRKIRDVETTPERGRRSSDNAETDIDFDTTDDVTLTSPVGAGGDLTTWAGVDDVFVPTLYDQSATGLDVTQATSGNQPQIISSGALVKSGGLPAWDNNGKAGWSSGSNLDLTGASEVWGFFVSDWDNVSSKGRIFEHGEPFGSSGGIFDTLLFSTDATNNLFVGLYNGGNSNRVYNRPSGRVLTTFKVDLLNGGADWIEVWVNGVLQTPVSSLDSGSRNTFPNGKVAFLSRINIPAESYTDKAQELVIFTGDKSSERTAIEADINGYFNIY